MLNDYYSRNHGTWDKGTHI